MVFSYLIVVAMGLLEWRVLGTENRPRAGVVQLVLLFIGGALLSITLLFLSKEAQQPVGGLYLLMELIAVILFATRVLPSAIRGWGTSAAGRHIATSAVLVIIAIAIFMYMVFRFITDPNLDVNNPNITGTLIASDHSAFVGVITNLMLGLLLVLTGDRVGRRAGLDTAAYWGLNVGLVIFLVGLVANVAIVKEIGAPLMGISLLLALALAAERFMASDLSVAEAPAAA
jgi:hypothetical protein